MKGIIAEINKKYAIVLTQDGTFKKIKAKSGMAVGAEVDLDQPSNSVISARLIAKVSSAAAAVLFVLGAGYCAYSYTVPYSYVDIDINPSIELTANIYDRIIKAEALNDEGRDLLESESLKNVKLDAGLAMLLNKAYGQGFLKPEIMGENTVLMTVTSKDEKKSEKLRNEVEKAAVSELEKNEIISEVLIAEASIIQKDEARKLGVTPGRLVLIEDAVEDEPELKFEELKKAPVNELVKKVRDKKAEKEAENGAKKKAGGGVKEELKEQQKEEKKEGLKEQLKEQMKKAKEKEKEKEEVQREEKKKEKEEEKKDKKSNTAKGPGGIAAEAVKNLISKLSNLDYKDDKKADTDNKLNKDKNNGVDKNYDSRETEKEKEERERKEKQRLRDELLGPANGKVIKKGEEARQQSEYDYRDNNKNKGGNGQDKNNKGIDSGKKASDNDKKHKASESLKKEDSGSKKENNKSSKNDKNDKDNKNNKSNSSGINNKDNKSDNNSKNGNKGNNSNNRQSWTYKNIAW